MITAATTAAAGASIASRQVACSYADIVCRHFVFCTPIQTVCKSHDYFFILENLQTWYVTNDGDPHYMSGYV